MSIPAKTKSIKILKHVCLNVRGWNVHEKICEISGMMHARDLDATALNKTKLKGKAGERKSLIHSKG